MARNNGSLGRNGLPIRPLFACCSEEAGVRSQEVEPLAAHFSRNAGRFNEILKVQVIKQFRALFIWNIPTRSVREILHQSQLG